MEAMVRPRKWSDLPEAYQKTFKGFRSEEGFNAAMDANVFIEKVLQNGVIRPLSDDEMQAYRTPFENYEDRVPTIAFPREIPFDGDPADNHTRVQAYSDWLTESDLPKLFINTTEGHALIGPNREFCRTWKNQKEITLNGKHYLQEDSPDELGEAIAEWIPNL